MREQTLHKRLTFTLQIILIIGLVAEIIANQWFASVLTGFIILVTFIPLFLERKFRVFIPPEFVLLAIAFVFASAFLGIVHGYYDLFWWWDIVLHTASGFLLGIIGFLLVYILNEAGTVDLDLKPVFTAFFAFLFALGIGTAWEIFEFSMDVFFDAGMQTPMLGDPSGLTDTMFDLIVDAVGALVISVTGYSYLKAAKNKSFLERWIHLFITKNPQLFRQK